MSMKAKSYKLVVLAVASCLTACTMTKYGITQAQADQDSYECRREARTITNGAPIDAYRDCMHARGYR